MAIPEIIKNMNNKELIRTEKLLKLAKLLFQKNKAMQVNN